MPLKNAHILCRPTKAMGVGGSAGRSRATGPAARGLEAAIGSLVHGGEGLGLGEDTQLANRGRLWCA